MRKLLCWIGLHDWYNADPEPKCGPNASDADAFEAWLRRTAMYVCRRCRERKP